MGLQTPEKIRTFQRKLYLKAKSEGSCGTSCGREATGGSRQKEFLANLAYYHQGRLWMPPDVCFKVKPVGKPDAGDPQVRFDERGWETESWQVGLRRRIERDVNSHRKPKITAPIFDSTLAANPSLSLCMLN